MGSSQKQNMEIVVSSSFFWILLTSFFFTHGRIQVLMPLKLVVLHGYFWPVDGEHRGQGTSILMGDLPVLSFYLVFWLAMLEWLLLPEPRFLSDPNRKTFCLHALSLLTCSGTCSVSKKCMFVILNIELLGSFVLRTCPSLAWVVQE